LVTASGKTLDPSHIRMAGFTTTVDNQNIYIKEVFPSMDGETEATAIEAPFAEENLKNKDVYFDLSGRRVDHPTKGIYIVNGKKVIY